MLNKEEESQEELEAHIEHEKRNIYFYTRYYGMLREKMSDLEIEKAIDFHLDRLIILLRIRNQNFY